LADDLTFNVVITTYEFVISDKAKLGRIAWNYIILDEGQRIKVYHYLAVIIIV